MELLCYTFDLKPGTEEAYDEAHVRIPWEVLGAMRDAGISNYSLFRRGTHVVAYGHCAESIEKSLAILAASEADQRWRESISPLFASALDESGQLLLAPEVWRMPEEMSPHSKEGGTT